MGALPELTARLFGEVMALFEAGVLHPLPYRAFPAERAEDAFRYMQQARQIGKVLVTYPSGTPAPTRGVTRAGRSRSIRMARTWWSAARAGSVSRARAGWSSAAHAG